MCIYVAGAEATAGLWMATWFIYTRGMAPETAATCCSLFYLGITLGRVVSGALSAKVRDRKLVRWGILTALCGIVVILLPLPGFMSVVGLFITGFGGAPVYPCIVHSTPERYGEKYSSTVIGLEMAAAYVGSTCMPIAAGFISGQFGMFLIPFFLLIAFVAMLINTEYVGRI